MADAKKLELAKVVYNTICQTLDHDDWHYTRHDEEFTIETGARGEDLSIDLIIRVDVDKSLIMILSPMPFTVDDDKRLDVAIAVSAINNILVHGCFDYNVTNGRVYFRLPNSFVDSKISEAVVSYLVYCACHMIDEYNDKLLMLVKGMLSLEQLMKMVLDT